MRIIALAIATLTAARADAACRWAWDCTAGQRRRAPICDSPLDIPPPKPPGAPPIAPPSILPVQPQTLPPVGTQQCSQTYLCSFGRCSRQSVCR